MWIITRRIRKWLNEKEGGINTSLIRNEIKALTHGERAMVSVTRLCSGTNKLEEVIIRWENEVLTPYNTAEANPDFHPKSKLEFPR